MPVSLVAWGTSGRSVKGPKQIYSRSVSLSRSLSSVVVTAVVSTLPRHVCGHAAAPVTIAILDSLYFHVVLASGNKREKAKR